MTLSTATHVLSLVGRTPMLELHGFELGPCRLFLKLEGQNPGGSIKDRVALSMVDAAEREGKLRPGNMLVEATAGNTGLGLALVAGQRGYRLTLVIPDKMSREKILHLKAMGAQVIMTRSDVGKGHPAYYQDLAEDLVRRTPGAYYVNQFNNPANPTAHETGTGPEIFEQLQGRLDAMVCGVGSGGTFTGLSRYFARVAPQVEMVLADPVGSVLAPYVTTGKLGAAGSWLVEGIGEDFLPGILDLSRAAAAFSISDQESLATARLLLTRTGVLAGSSTGTLLAAALRYCQQQQRPKTVVTLAPDSGSKYLTKMFNDHWMQDHGLLPSTGQGDLRDLISHRHAHQEVATLEPSDTLMRAYGLMKLHDVSQLPVVRQERVVGMVDESDVLLAVTSSPDGFGRTVEDVMITGLTTVSPGTSLRELQTVLEKGLVAIVVEGSAFLGLITRMDLLRHLRAQVRS